MMGGIRENKTQENGDKTAQGALYLEVGMILK